MGIWSYGHLSKRKGILSRQFGEVGGIISICIARQDFVLYPWHETLAIPSRHVSDFLEAGGSDWERPAPLTLSGMLKTKPQVVVALACRTRGAAAKHPLNK